MLKTMLPILCLGLLANTLSADIIHPGSLNNGDKYRYAFVTSTTRDATSSNIADYDAHVQAAIMAADPTVLGAISWRAWGSTSTVNAIDHLSTTTAGTWDGSDVPIYLINSSNLVASSFADLTDGSLSYPILTDESGTVTGPGVPTVWTGTDAAGIKDSGLGYFGTIFSGVVCGKTVPDTSPEDWTFYLLPSRNRP